MATDWEATNEAIEEQVARESYIQYFRDSERRLKNQGHSLACGSSSTVTSAMISSPRSSRRGSCSPKGSQSPKGSCSPKTTFSPLGNFIIIFVRDQKLKLFPQYLTRFLHKDSELSKLY